RGREVGVGEPAAYLLVDVLRGAQLRLVVDAAAGHCHLASDPRVVDPAGQDERQHHPPRHRPQLDERAGPLEEQSDRHRLQVQRSERREVGMDRLEDRPLERRAVGGEVLLERHRGRALVRLVAATEAAIALRARPGGHRTIVPRQVTSGRNAWVSGPIASAYTTVPTPTVPPSSQPVASTASSMPVRITRTDTPVRATRPVIRPSRGPGPSRTPM